MAELRLGRAGQGVMGNWAAVPGPWCWSKLGPSVGRILFWARFSRFLSICVISWHDPSSMFRLHLGAAWHWGGTDLVQQIWAFQAFEFEQRKGFSLPNQAVNSQ